MMTNPKIFDRTIFVYDGVVPQNLCQEIIQKFDASDMKFPGVTSSGKSTVKESQEMYIDPDTEYWKDIDRILFEAYSKSVKDYFNHFPWIKFSYKDVGYFVKRYERNRGYYHTHIDSSVLKNSNRILVSIIYLNTVDIGGETEFTDIDLKIKPSQGSVLLFPPMWMFPHRSNMAISGDKYTVNTFFVMTE